MAAEWAKNTTAAACTASNMMTEPVHFFRWFDGTVVVVISMKTLLLRFLNAETPAGLKQAYNKIRPSAFLLYVHS